MFKYNLKKINIFYSNSYIIDCDVDTCKIKSQFRNRFQIPYRKMAKHYNFINSWNIKRVNGRLNNLT